MNWLKRSILFLLILNAAIAPAAESIHCYCAEYAARVEINNLERGIINRNTTLLFEWRQHHYTMAMVDDPTSEEDTEYKKPNFNSHLLVSSDYNGISFFAVGEPVTLHLANLAEPVQIHKAVTLKNGEPQAEVDFRAMLYFNVSWASSPTRLHGMRFSKPSAIFDCKYKLN